MSILRRQPASSPLLWREVSWQRPFELSAVEDVLAQLAATHPRGYVCWEVRGFGGKVRYLLGAERDHLSQIAHIFKSHGDVRLGEPEPERTQVVTTVQVKVSGTTLSLNTEAVASMLRAALTVFSNVGNGEELCLQIVLGASYAPRTIPDKFTDPNASWFSIATGTAKRASGDILKSAKEKAGQGGFEAAIRIGSTNERYGVSRIQDLLNALRMMRSAGVKVYATEEAPSRLDIPSIPTTMPLRLSVKEMAALFLLPSGDELLPGSTALHPKVALPPEWYKEPKSVAEDRSFAVSADGKRISIAPRDALLHTILLGPTGAGKSTAMLNMILADIQAGRSVLVVDPKKDLITDILQRIPDSRIENVVVLDPSSAVPVGFNPLYSPTQRDKELVADTVLSALKEIFADSWGVYTQDLLSAAILTLMGVDQASLMWIPELLTNEDFRRSITKSVKDRLGLGMFWERFEDMAPTERRQRVEPILNKLRQFLLRPKLRAVLGQSRPKFDLSQLFTERKILLVPLNKGVVGAESARLLGSLVVGLTWALALSRANVAPDSRHFVGVYIDELQDYLNLPTDLPDALSQARAMGLAITMAHQYRDQLTPSLRAGIDANALNKIVFGLSSGKDARDMASVVPGLDPLDFSNLSRYHIYASIQNGGKGTGWIKGETLPKPGPVRDARDLYVASMERYGTEAEEVELELLRSFGRTHTGADRGASSTTISAKLPRSNRKKEV